MHHFRPYQKQTYDKLLDCNDPVQLVVLPTGCVVGDATIRLNRAKKGFQTTLEREYIQQDDPRRNKCVSSKIRSLSKDQNFVCLNDIGHGVSYSGKKQCVEIKTKNRSLRLTPDHLVWTDQGWIEAKNLLGKNIGVDTPKAIKSKKKNKKLRDKRVELRFHPYARKINSAKYVFYTIEIHRAIYEAKINNLELEEYLRILRKDKSKAKKLKFIDPKIYDIHHIDFDHYNNDPENLIHLTKSDHQKIHGEKNVKNFSQGKINFEKVFSVQDCGVHEVYDVVNSETMSFTANDIIVHNSGKTFIFTQYVAANKHKRILVLLSSVRLCQQTIKEFQHAGLKPTAYCAGLGEKQLSDLTVATIQSISDVDYQFDEYIVDEAHNSNMEDTSGQYYKFLKDAKKIIGFTATPFTGKGEKIYGDDMFWNEPIHEVTMKELTEQGYLVPIIMRGNDKEIKYRDPTNMETAAEDIQDKVSAIVSEAVQLTKNRKHIAWITPNIRIANKVHALVRGSWCVHSGWSDNWNENSLRDWKEQGGHLISVNMLSEGFNFPPTDTLVLMRPTRSPRLFVQAVGRIARTHATKQNGVLLDYGNVIEELGDVYSINAKKPIGRGLKLCPECLLFMSSTRKHCHSCGFEFATSAKSKDFVYQDVTKNLTTTAGRGYPRTYEIKRVALARHVSKAGKENIKVRFFPVYGECLDLYLGTEQNYWNYKRMKSFVEKYCHKNITKVNLKNLQDAMIEPPFYVVVEKINGWKNVLL